MVQLPTNHRNVDSRSGTNPAKIVLIILILTIAVADFVTIAELPYFVRNLHTGGKNSGPEHARLREKTESDNIDGSAKDQMTPMMEAEGEPVYLLE
jgi:hypothetical protein